MSVVTLFLCDLNFCHCSAVLTRLAVLCILRRLRICFLISLFIHGLSLILITHCLLGIVWCAASINLLVNVSFMILISSIVSMKSQFILDSLVLNELKSAFLKSHTNLLNEWVRICETFKQANMGLWSLHIGSRTPCSIIDAGEFVSITSSKVLDGSRVVYQ